ncbi:MAG TPA: sigma factor [Planctomycetota bacterium]|nr:sigma factor [Planctomycetota bacterium]
MSVPSDSGFVATRWSVVSRAGGPGDSEARAALAWLVERYWEPLRLAARRWGCDQPGAEDAVQDFCCRLVERRLELGAVVPERGRFRAWLLVVFRNFLRDRVQRDGAAKRGGGATMVDAALADPPAPETADPCFDRDWALALLDRAETRLAGEHAGPPERLRFAQLKPFLTVNGTGAAYAAAGIALGLGEGAVKVAVHRLRHRLRELARLEVAETLSEPTPRAIDDELQALAEALTARIR